MDAAPDANDELLAHIAKLTMRVAALEDENEDLRARLCAVERATPWKGPKKPNPPANTYQQNLLRLQAEAAKRRSAT